MLNRVILIGRLVADPEMRTTANGVSVAVFRIAIDRYSKSAERQTDFITGVAWRERAEFACRYFTKGRLIGIEGSIQTRSYTDKEGNKRNVFEVVADRLFFVESKAKEGAEGSNATARETAQGGDFEVIDPLDDLPF